MANTFQVRIKVVPIFELEPLILADLTAHVVKGIQPEGLVPRTTICPDLIENYLFFLAQSISFCHLVINYRIKDPISRHSTSINHSDDFKSVLVLEF